jgi:putative peptidoglycan lipid II flippase
MSAGTLVSRVLGQVRSILLILAIGGTTLTANCFDVANTIPNILLAIITGGFINSILVPQIVKALKDKNSDERLSKLLTFSGFVMFILTVTLTILTPIIVSVFVSSSWTAGQKELAFSFGIICMPQIFFYGMYALIGQFLAAKEQFTMYFWAPIINNIVSIVGLGIFILMYGPVVTSGAGTVDFWSSERIWLLAGTATLGIIAQTVALIPSFLKLGFKLKFILTLKGFELRKLFSLAIWSFSIIILENVLGIVFTRITSSAPMLAVGHIGVAGNYAFNLAQVIFIVPNSVITTTIITRVFTKLSQYYYSKDSLGFVSALESAMSKIIKYEVFSMGLFFVLSIPITLILVPSADVYTVLDLSALVLCFSASFGWIGLYFLLRRVYFVLEDSKKAFFLTIPSAVVTLIGIAITMLFVPPENYAYALAVVFVVGKIVPIIFILKVVGADIRKSFNQSLPAYFNVSREIVDLIKVIVAFVPTLLIGTLVNSLFNVKQSLINSVNTIASVASGTATGGTGTGTGTTLDVTTGVGHLWFTSVLECLVVGAIMFGVYFGILKLLQANKKEDK